MKPLSLAVLLWFSAIVADAEEVTQLPPPSSKEAQRPELRQELLRRMKVDQDARQAAVHLLNQPARVEGDSPVQRLTQLGKSGLMAAKVFKIDKDNTEWLKSEVDQHGWPAQSIVGEDAGHAAWLLVQHADADPRFQRKCLDLMLQLSWDEVSPQDVAYLTDRVLLAEGKKQVYGTQFATVDGRLQPKPIQDEATIDEKRAKVGLGPLAEYAKQLEQIYSGDAKEMP